MRLLPRRSTAFTQSRRARLCCLSFSAVALSSLVVSSSTCSAFVPTTTTSTPSSPSSFVSPGVRKNSMSSCMSATSTDYMGAMAAAASEALGREVHLKPARGGGMSGGGGASTSAVVDEDTGDKYFVKAARNDGGMLRAEYLGVKAMADTNTIQVPTPVCFGEHAGQNFVLFEYLEMTGGGSQYELGVQLAKMHRHTSEKGFGFDVDNTIGATPQPNQPWKQDWADFWDTHRLNHMLKLSGNAGLSDAKVQELREKTKQLLSHNPEPSLIHGDLWGGNKAFCKKNGQAIPVIFDPATYYGDREADVAMTYVFGGFSGDFYKGYNDEWPLPEGHDKRRTVYNLYHILNHYVLFGGGYLSQAKSMIDQILRM